MKTWEKIENEIAAELGWRWTPQMRHAYKMQKLWEKLIHARLFLALNIERIENMEKEQKGDK